MTRPRRRTDLARLAKALAQHDTARLAARVGYHAELERRHPSQPDGYPTRTPGSDSGGRGSSDSSTVEAAVQARATHRDEHAELTDRAIRRLVDAVNAVDDVAALVHALDRGDHDRANLAADNDRAWCRSHARFGLREPRSLSGRRDCDWCYTFHREQGQWPPKQLLDLHDQGKRLSVQLVARVLAHS